MYRVDLRFTGQGLWNTSAPPMTLQAALGQARVMQNGRFADDARVLPAHGATVPPELRLIDVRA